MLKLEYKAESAIFPEFNDRYKEIFEKVILNKITMSFPMDLFSTMNAARHVARNNIEGDFVECGVWRGGNSIAAKLVFQIENCTKEVHCFDTFAGMVEPSDYDISLSGHRKNAREKFEKSKAEDHNNWCYASLDEVKENFENFCGLNGVNFYQGDVRNTLLREENLPNKISVLRLDTDWYESTKVEINVLYPRLVTGGVLLLDDYALWDGHRRAIDEYFEALPVSQRPMLQFVSEKGRCAIKL